MSDFHPHRAASGAAFALAATVAFALIAPSPAAAHDIDTHVLNLVDLTGAGAAAGASFKAGVELAQRELAVTLILGTSLQWHTVDTRSDPAAAAEALRKAIEDESPYAVLGTVLPDTTLAIAGEAGRHLILTISVADPPAARGEDNPFLIHATLSPARRFARLMRWLNEKRRVRIADVVVSASADGRRDREEIGRALAAQSIAIGVDAAIDPSARALADTALRIAASRADAVLVFLDPANAASLVRELRARGVSRLFAGDSRLAAAGTSQDLGPAAEGIVALTEMSPDAPQRQIRSFGERFEKAYGRRPDEYAMRGYAAMYMLSAVTEQIGRRSPRAFAKRARNLALSAFETPGLLLDAAFDATGALDRASFVVEVRGGKAILIDTLPADPVTACRGIRC